MSKGERAGADYQVFITDDTLYCIASGIWGVSQPLFRTSFGVTIDECLDDVLKQATAIEEQMGWSVAVDGRDRAKILRALERRGVYDECEDEGIFMRLEKIVIHK